MNFRKILKISPSPVDNGILCMVLCGQMNNVQAKIDQLQENGWTLAAIADGLGITPNTVEKWKAGDRYPRLEKPARESLDRLILKKRIPKKRRYSKGNR